jgi:hypothetical protein
MINLFIPYFIDKNEERYKEIYHCLQQNVLNKHIDRIILISENPDVYRIMKRHDVIIVPERPTYAMMFEIINEITGPNDWNVLINSDIYLDETIKLIKNYDSNTFLALARWDLDAQGNAKLFNTWDSQDTWAFKGKSKNIKADFVQGKAGCDNAIANRAEVAGYKVINPSKTIKTYHLHLTNLRNYDPKDKVPQPYKLINPHE